MGKKKKSKSLKKLNKKLKKLDKEMYDNNKSVSREEFLVKKLSGRLKRYYNSLSEENKLKLISYILKQEDWGDSWENRDSLSKYSEDDDFKLTSKVCRNLSELNRDIAKTRKKRKKKKNFKSIFQKSKKNKDLLLLNPEAYDQLLLSDKDYRKYLKNLVKKDKKKDMPVEIDCTMENFRNELMGNKKVNSAVMDSFWNKHGY